MQNIFRIKVIIVLFYSLVFLLLAEIILRQTGSFQTYSEEITEEYKCPYGKTSPYFHLWGPSSEFILDHKDFKYSYSINALGIREVEYRKEKQLGKKRILCFGDSFTEGVGAPYDSSYVRELERQVKKKSPDFEVYNCAVSGSDPFYNYVLLKDKMIYYNPDIVTFTLNPSDLTDFIFCGGMERFKENKVLTKPAPFFEPFFHYSHFVRFIAISLMGYDWTLLNKSEQMKMVKNGVDAYFELFTQINQLCEANGIKFLLILHPHPDYFLYQEGLYNNIIKMESNLYKNHINFIDVFPSLSKVMNTKNIYKYSWKTDGHYNSAGYKVLGEGILSETEKKYPGFWAE